MTPTDKQNCVCKLVENVCNKEKLCLSPMPAELVLQDHRGWREYKLRQSCPYCLLREVAVEVRNDPGTALLIQNMLILVNTTNQKKSCGLKNDVQGTVCVCIDQTGWP